MGWEENKLPMVQQIDTGGANPLQINIKYNFNNITLNIYIFLISTYIIIYMNMLANILKTHRVIDFRLFMSIIDKSTYLHLDVHATKVITHTWGLIDKTFQIDWYLYIKSVSGSKLKRSYELYIKLHILTHFIEFLFDFVCVQMIMFETSGN